MIFRSRFFSRIFTAALFLGSAGAALAHPGHPGHGHDNDPYRKEGGLVELAGGLSFALPLAALGGALALTKGKTRAGIAFAVAALMAATAFQHGPEWRPVAGLLIAGTLHLATGFVLGRAWRFLRETAGDDGAKARAD